VLVLSHRTLDSLESHSCSTYSAHIFSSYFISFHTFLFFFYCSHNVFVITESVYFYSLFSFAFKYSRAPRFLYRMNFYRMRLLNKLSAETADILAACIGINELLSVCLFVCVISVLRFNCVIVRRVARSEAPFSACRSST